MATLYLNSFERLHMLRLAAACAKMHSTGAESTHVSKMVQRANTSEPKLNTISRGDYERIMSKVRSQASSII